ncbi:hypothetical protein [Leisingera sp. S232]|uniref:hypothetical protein n=1 Tax=Leisingera sp. S232 TaxID=3415132 RepID=UPI003C7BFB2D
MDLIALFLAGVPVFAVLALVPQARAGVFLGLAAAAAIWAAHQMLPPVTGSDAAGNAMAKGFRAFLYASAAGGGAAACLFHLTRIAWPAVGSRGVRIFRFVFFLAVSIPLGATLLVFWEEVLR